MLGGEYNCPVCGVIGHHYCPGRGAFTGGKPTDSMVANTMLLAQIAASLEKLVARLDALMEREVGR